MATKTEQFEPYRAHVLPDKQILLRWLVSFLSPIQGPRDYSKTLNRVKNRNYYTGVYTMETLRINSSVAIVISSSASHLPLAAKTKLKSEV